MSSGWTDERTETAKAMYGEGYSASEIARAIKGVSRHAVIGKLHRLGVIRPAGAAALRLQTRLTMGVAGAKTERPHKPPAVKSPGTTPQSVECRQAAMPAMLPQVPGQFSRPFGDRTRLECSWPIGDGADLMSCCAPVVRGNLCAEHAVVGYQPKRLHASTEPAMRVHRTGGRGHGGIKRERFA